MPTNLTLPTVNEITLLQKHKQIFDKIGWDKTMNDAIEIGLCSRREGEDIIMCYITHGGHWYDSSTNNLNKLVGKIVWNYYLSARQ